MKIADIINRLSRRIESDQFGDFDYVRLDELMDELSSMFEEDNYRFNKDAFISRCTQ
jgi:hypothetical protein